ncbi:EAL domain-containing protein [Geobacter sp. SVR]|uniref:EAL domain-containing protein n=1 Tax=Geobacter sp. SVR TaxID=2495594 RepID=UPI00143EF5EC|nr:EAL domain-containing protein [Geobacter sp. SVR]BCS54807.1 GGDEF domain-containing protein [Geobacter sp. SVR]GCF86385.1 GGDEF domain-containing protein [Geobacter sp. SVR]
MDTELRILILEDSATDAELVQHALRREGFTFDMRRVETGEEFGAALLDYGPGLILSDYSLPSFDGLTALRLAQETLPDVPFIFISGTLGEERAIEILKMGATDYVLKDRLSRLAPIVHRALQEARERIVHRRTQEALRKSEEIYRRIVETAQEGVWIVNTEGETIFVNSRMSEILGYTDMEFRGFRMVELMDASARHRASIDLERQAGRVEHELRLRHRDGSLRWVSMATSPLFDDRNRQIGVLSMINDVTARKQAEDERNKLWAAVETGGDWVLITDIRGTVEYANRAVEHISGYGKDEILGRNTRMFKSEKQDDSLYRQMWKDILAGKSFRSMVVNRKKDNNVFHLDLTITPLMDESGTIVNFVATGKDISEKKLMEERLNYLAYNDLLTGLANRSLFFDRLQQAITITNPGKKLVFAAIIDLQRFKYINETFGVSAGDEILKEVARRLTDAVRPGDTVARYGGNSFGVILPEIGETRDGILIIERVITHLSRPYQCGHEELINTFSVGIAIAPTDSNAPQVLMRHAEAALFRAKDKKGNSYRFYTPGMNIIATDFLAMEKNLYHALEANEFVLQYQPYFDIRSGELKGMEALIRWRQKDGSLILPGDFIPILEETGQIVAVGDWVIKTACEQIAAWRSAGIPLAPVSVNLSPTQFRQENLVSQIIAHLAAYDVPTGLITIEITENIFIRDIDYTRQIFEQFRALGIHLSIDDFGTGYSSLSYLARLPLDNLKIDISFIVNLVRDPKAFSIAKVIITMAHELGMKTIAEGVETAEQLAILKQLGCDLVQGFFHHRSLTGDEMGALLREGRSAHLPTNP